MFTGVHLPSRLVTPGPSGGRSGLGSALIDDRLECRSSFENQFRLQKERIVR